MSAPDFLLGAAGLALAIAAARAVLRRTEAGPTARAALALLAAAATALAFAGIAAEWLAQPENPWNAARIAPAVSLRHGYALYYPLHAGPILSTVVGPVAFLFYLPVAYLFDRPTALILAGSLLNLVGCGALIVLLVRRLAPDGITRLFAGLALAHLALLYPALRYSLFGIHADAPALLFATLGAGLVIFSAETLSWRRALVAAGALVLAAWAKQSLAFLLPLLISVAAIRQGRTSAGRLFGSCVLVGMIAALGFVGAIGFGPLRDNLITVPAAHPWQQMDLATGQVYPHLHAAGLAARAKVLVAAILQLIRTDWLLFAAMGAAIFTSALRAAPAGAQEPRAPWRSFSLLALGMLPVAALGRVKVGGEINHESLVLCFLVPAFVGWLAQRQPGDSRLVRAPLLAAVVAVLTLINAPRAATYQGWTTSWNNQNEVAFRYDRAHPGRVYFPWNPLTSLLARGKLHHFDYGVFDRGLGRERVTREHVLEHLPEPEPVIASYIAHHDHILRTYFPHYRELSPDADLPGWRRYGPAGTPEPR